MNTARPADLATSTSARLAATALSVVLTLAMLLGIGTLAEVDDSAARMAQSGSAART